MRITFLEALRYVAEVGYPLSRPVKFKQMTFFPLRLHSTLAVREVRGTLGRGAPHR